MRPRDRLAEVLRTVRPESFVTGKGPLSQDDSTHFMIVIRGATSALEVGSVNGDVVTAIRNRLDDFTSPHIRELLTEALHYIEKDTRR